MTKPAVVTFAQLPDEAGAFLAYLAKTGDVWARAEGDAPADPAHAPAPAAEFLAAHAAALARAGGVRVYLGPRPDVLAPPVSTVSGGPHVDIFAACLIGYRQGGYYPGGELAQSNLCFYRGAFLDGVYVRKPEAFQRWAGKVLGWARRRTPERVPVYRCNYKTRATARVAEASRGGLKVWY